jgi:pimeloyl-ACP methyl ester carboxylesterase
VNAETPYLKPTFNHSPLAHLASSIGLVLSRVCFSFVILLLMIPILLLPIGTSDPVMSWASLALVDAVLLVVMFKTRWRLRNIVLTCGGMLFIAGLAVVLSQLFASTPRITDAQGNVLPNSIASLEKVTLNGSEQWITLRGKDISKPVLLYLGLGGPGAGGFAMRPLFQPLEDYFVVVSWDEPGTGKSYNARPIQQLTPQRFVEDARALTQLLRERFHQDKIYIYGVSWTSFLGIWLAQQYPELYYAYIGTGQMVNATQDDIMGYEFAINYLTERGDTATVDALRRNGPPPYVGSGMALKYIAYLDVLNDYMGSIRYAIAVPLIPMFASEYGLLDKVNHFRGLYESFEFVYPQLKDVDLATQATDLKIPIYFLVGQNDVNAMTSLVEHYYGVLKAPHKELIWLKNGSHGLDEATMSQFIDVMLNKVLPQTQTK